MHIPSEDETFEILGPLKGLWYESLYSAILDTSKHFKANSDHDFEQRQLLSWHIRSKFQKLLAPNAEEYDFSIVEVTGGSFLLTHKFFVCKFRKAFNGCIPLPTSKTQLKFYNSNDGNSIWPTFPGWEPVRTVASGGAIHLIVYYDITPQQELAWIKIACPKFATHAHVDSFWDKTVDNPLYNGDMAVRHSKKERKDLSFSLLDDNTSTELAE